MDECLCKWFRRRMLNRIRALLGIVVLCHACSEPSTTPPASTPQTTTPGATPATSHDHETPAEEETPAGGETQEDLAVAKCTDEPGVLADAEAAPYSLVDAGNDYLWTTSAGGKSKIRIWRRVTGKVETLSSRQRQTGALAVRDDEVFFAEVSYATQNDPGQIVKVSLTTKKATTVIAGTAGEAMDDFSIAADDGAIFWLTHDPTTLEQHVWRFDDGAAMPEQIGSVKLPVDQTISRLRLDGAYVYWATASGWAYRVSKAGGMAELVIDDVDGIGGWDVRDGVVAYADLGTNGALHLAQTPGASTTVVTQAHARFGVHLTDDAVLYATDAALCEVARSGGPAGVVVADAASVASIVIAGDELGWAETKSTGGRVRTMCLAAAKPVAPEPECPIEFSKTKVCASITWSSGPTKQATNAYRLRFWPKGQAASGPYSDATTSVAVKLWMPAHGHGSTAPTVTKVAPGEYDVTAVNFTMSGDWQLQHTLKDAGGAAVERADAAVVVP